MQTGIEACRLRREVCGGVAIWQFNEPWPAVTWSIVDHAGRPKTAYRRLQQCFQPLLVAARFPWRRYLAGELFEAEIWVVNDGQATWPGCRVLADLDGWTAPVGDSTDILPAGSRRVGKASYKLPAPPQGLTLRLLTAGEDALLATNFYDLAVPFPKPQPFLARANRLLARLLIRSG